MRTEVRRKRITGVWKRSATASARVALSRSEDADCGKPLPAVRSAPVLGEYGHLGWAALTIGPDTEGMANAQRCLPSLRQHAGTLEVLDPSSANGISGRLRMASNNDARTLRIRLSTMTPHFALDAVRQIVAPGRGVLPHRCALRVGAPEGRGRGTGSRAGERRIVDPRRHPALLPSSQIARDPAGPALGYVLIPEAADDG